MPVREREMNRAKSSRIGRRERETNARIRERARENAAEVRAASNSQIFISQGLHRGDAGQ